MIKAVIFDCFGVLITDGLSQMVEAVPRETQVEIRDLLHASHRGIKPKAESGGEVARLLGMSLDEYQSKIDELELKNEPLMEYIMSLRPRYKTALLSNIAPGTIYKRFTNDELSGMFDELFTSGDLGIAKPNPEIYEYAAAKLGFAPEECVFTDDRLDFCEAAERVGMKAIQFTSLSDFTGKLITLLDS